MKPCIFVNLMSYFRISEIAGDYPASEPKSPMVVLSGQVAQDNALKTQIIK